MYNKIPIFLPSCAGRACAPNKVNGCWVYKKCVVVRFVCNLDLISWPLGRTEGKKKKNRRFQEGCIMNVPERNNWWGYEALLSRTCNCPQLFYPVYTEPASLSSIDYLFSYESFPGERVEIEIRVCPRTEPCAFPSTPYGLTVTDATNLSTGVPLLPHPPILSQYYYFLFFQFFNLESFPKKVDV